MQQQQHLDAKPGMADILDLLVAQDGTGSHDYVVSGALLAPPHEGRNLADAVHYLGVLHGRYPGVVDHAATKTADGAARGWMLTAADAFAGERAYLARLAVAIGPVPGTPGQVQCESALAAQRHALDMLAQSDRKGCAIGAAIALCLDWLTVRAVLDMAAERVNLVPPACTLPDVRRTAALANALSGTAGAERAMHFGAEQILTQHRGLWDLLRSRAEARGDS